MLVNSNTQDKNSLTDNNMNANLNQLEDILENSISNESED